MGRDLGVQRGGGQAGASPGVCQEAEQEGVQARQRKTLSWEGFALQAQDLPRGHAIRPCSRL